MNTPEAYEHFKLIRESPAYRHELMMIDLEAERQPPLYYAEPVPEIERQPEIWTKKQWDTVQQLRAMVLHLQNKIVELSKTKKNYDPF